MPVTFDELKAQPNFFSRVSGKTPKEILEVVIETAYQELLPEDRADSISTKKHGASKSSKRIP